MTAAHRGGRTIGVDLGGTNIAVGRPRVGQVLADLASILDPAVLVLGGGLSQTGELIRRPAERAYLRPGQLDSRTKEGDLPWVNCSSSGTGKRNGPCAGAIPA